MSMHLVFNCDICGRILSGEPITAATATVQAPLGWHQQQFKDSLDHSCGECVSAFGITFEAFKTARIKARIASKAKGKP